MEHLPGCPICEHNDPELERELQALAQLLFDIYIAKQNEAVRRGQDDQLDIAS